MSAIALNPIGVFDSGVGGLSVLRALRDELPDEDFLYVADSAYAPYGERTNEFVQRRASGIVEFLIREQAKAIVVACNTATGIAVDALRSRFQLPIVAIEPAVKPAVAQTRSGVIGVLATSGTIASERFRQLLAQYAAGARILPQACPGLVEQVERGERNSPSTRALVEQFVRPLIEQGADTLVLGCTHYPFLDEAIRAVAGPDVTVIDPAAAVARELRRRLEDHDLLRSVGTRGKEWFWTTGDPDRAKPVMTQLWSESLEIQHLSEFLSS